MRVFLFDLLPWTLKVNFSWMFRNVLERSKNNSESLFFFCYVTGTFPEHSKTFRKISERLFDFRTFTEGSLWVSRVVFDLILSKIL
jgi:hypothetical protein